MMACLQHGRLEFVRNRVDEYLFDIPGLAGILIAILSFPMPPLPIWDVIVKFPRVLPIDITSLPEHLAFMLFGDSLMLIICG